MECHTVDSITLRNAQKSFEITLNVFFALMRKNFRCFDAEICHESAMETLMFHHLCNTGLDMQGHMTSYS